MCCSPNPDLFRGSGRLPYLFSGFELVFVGCKSLGLFWLFAAGTIASPLVEGFSPQALAVDCRRQNAVYPYSRKSLQVAMSQGTIFGGSIFCANRKALTLAGQSFIWSSRRGRA